MTTLTSPLDQRGTQPHFQALKDSLKGNIFFPGDQTFADHSKIFNGAIRTKAIAVATPEDASDVSKIIVFCNKHRLSPSVKAGGYGTSGVSVGGDIIIDLTRLKHITINLPDDTIPRQYVGLRDQLSPGDKGKGKAKPQPPRAVSTPGSQGADLVSAVVVTPQKRRREAEDTDDEERAAYEARLRTYDPAAPRVSSFLSGPPLAPEPGVSRRMPPQDYRAPPLDTVNSTGSEATSMRIDGEPHGTGRTIPMAIATPESRADGLHSGTGAENLPSSVVDARGPFDHMNLTGESDTTDVSRPTPWLPSRPRPFDYLSTTGSSQDSGPVQQPTYQQSMRSAGGFTSFPSFSSNSPFPGPAFPPLSIPYGLPHSPLHSTGENSSFPTSASSLMSPHLPMDWENPPLDHRAPPEPRYPHVYVTFGAGMLQKEIDIHTADNPVEAKESAAGTTELIPYHVPTAAHPTGSAIMVLGGFGFLSRLHGLSIDNIVEVEMVLADGSIVIVNEGENPDLWWAIRGAGPCFGVATRYIAKAFPVPVVFAGNLL